jgi:hypothetical protein
VKTAIWKDLAEFVGIAAIVGSLIFVGLQMQQEQKIAIADTYGSINESTAQIAELIENSAKVWREGLDGEELDSEDRIKFLSLVKAVQMHFSHMHIRWTMIGPMPPDIAARSYAYALYTYPGFRQARSEQIQNLEVAEIPLEGTFISSVLEREAEKFLMEFEETGTPMPEEKTYVFW